MTSVFFSVSLKWFRDEGRQRRVLRPAPDFLTSTVFISFSIHNWSSVLQSFNSIITFEYHLQTDYSNGSRNWFSDPQFHRRPRTLSTDYNNGPQAQTIRLWDLHHIIHSLITPLLLKLHEHRWLPLPKTNSNTLSILLTNSKTPSWQSSLGVRCPSYAVILSAVSSIFNSPIYRTHIITSFLCPTTTSSISIPISVTISGSKPQPSNCINSIKQRTYSAIKPPLILGHPFCSSWLAIEYLLKFIIKYSKYSSGDQLLLSSHELWRLWCLTKLTRQWRCDGCGHDDGYWYGWWKSWLHKLWEASMSQLRGEQSRGREEMLKLCWKEEGRRWRNWMDGSRLKCENGVILLSATLRYYFIGHGVMVGLDTGKM